MLPNEVLSDIICWSPGNAASGGYDRYFSDMAKKIGSDSLNIMSNHLTQHWVPLWHECSRDCFGTNELSNYDIYVVPSGVFSAETLIVDGSPCVVIHHGLMDLLSYSIETDLLTNRLYATGTNLRSAQQLKHRFVFLTRYLFHAFLNSPNRLPHFRKWFDESMTQLEFVLLSSAEIFVILHEIAHIRLGHLKPHTVEPETSRHTWHKKELEADIEAVRMVGSTEILVNGACSFLWWYAVYQGWTTNYPDFHPSARTRYANLVGTLGPDASFIRKSLDDDLNDLNTVESSLNQGVHKDWWAGEFPTPNKCVTEMTMILDVLLG